MRSKIATSIAILQSGDASIKAGVSAAGFVSGSLTVRSGDTRSGLSRSGAVALTAGASGKLSGARAKLYAGSSTSGFGGLVELVSGNGGSAGGVLLKAGAGKSRGGSVSVQSSSSQLRSGDIQMMSSAARLSSGNILMKTGDALDSNSIHLGTGKLKVYCRVTARKQWQLIRRILWRFPHSGWLWSKHGR